MAPTIIQPTPVAESGASNLKSSLRVRPLTKSGALDGYKQFDSTPAIGREFPDTQLADLITSPQADVLLRDLAITSNLPSPFRVLPEKKLMKVSERGVVFFRNQKGFTLELQKLLGQKLGELTGKPSTSGLHIHPVNNAARGGSVNERGQVNTDNQISVISSEHNQNLGIIKNIYSDKHSSDGWHSE